MVTEKYPGINPEHPFSISAAMFFRSIEDL